MHSLEHAIKKARADKKGPQISGEIERALLAKARKIHRRDRDRIKRGLISKERSQRQAEVQAVREAAQDISDQLQRLKSDE